MRVRPQQIEPTPARPPTPATRSTWALIVVLTVATLLAVPFAASGGQQTHAPAQPQIEQVAGEHGQEETAGEEHWIRDLIARLFNFALMVGVLVYFLKSPIARYLTSRLTQIRQDLVTAAELRATAAAQLEEIDRKLRALPAELEALKQQGAEDVRAERARIADAAAAERSRLLDQTRREIEMRLRVARRELLEYAAELAVRVARERIVRSITIDDQLRLVDRYTHQLQEVG